MTAKRQPSGVRVCSYCGTDIAHLRIDAKTCCRRHRTRPKRAYKKRDCSKRDYSNRNYGRRRCARCGRFFKAKGSTHFFCSRECQYKNLLVVNKVPGKCVTCGADFIGLKTTTHCSLQCASNDRERSINTCVCCKKEFESKHKDTKYCSGACSQRARNERICDDRHCRVCSVKIERGTGRGVSRFCSNSCRAQYARDDANWRHWGKPSPEIFQALNLILGIVRFVAVGDDKAPLNSGKQRENKK
jgi:ribosomal protein L24E